MRPVYACHFQNCGRSYVNPSILKRHIQAFHNLEKRFQCHTCGKCLASHQNLKEHSYIHTGEKPYKCLEPGCGKAFRQGTHLSAHKKIEHNSTPAQDISQQGISSDMSSLLELIKISPFEKEDEETVKREIHLNPISKPYTCMLPNIFEDSFS